MLITVVSLRGPSMRDRVRQSQALWKTTFHSPLPQISGFGDFLTFITFTHSEPFPVPARTAI